MSDRRAAMAAIKQTQPRALAYRRRRIAVTILKMVLIEGAVWGIAILSVRDMPELLFPVGIVLGVALPLLLVKPWRIIRRSFVGTVTAIEPVVRRVNRPGTAAGAHQFVQMVDAAFVCYTLTASDRKTRRVEVFHPYAIAYTEGDTLAVLGGLEYPVNLTPHEQIACPACGALTPRERGTCITCRARL